MSLAAGNGSERLPSRTHTAKAGCGATGLRCACAQSACHGGKGSLLSPSLLAIAVCARECIFDGAHGYRGPQRPESLCGEEGKMSWRFFTWTPLFLLALAAPVAAHTPPPWMTCSATNLAHQPFPSTRHN